MAIEWTTEFWVGAGFPNAGPIPNRPADQVQIDSFPRINPGQPTPPGFYEFVRGSVAGNAPFVARSRASFKAGSTGTVAFTAQITGGITLTVNGTTIIDQDNVTGTFSGTYNATQGQMLNAELLTDFQIGAPFGYLRAEGIELQENRIDPVRVSLSEDANGLFIDASIAVSFAPDDPIPDRFAINDPFDGTVLYSVRSTNPQLKPSGVKTVQGETLLSRLARQRFREAILEPLAFSGREALEWILLKAGVAHVNPIPEFLLRTGSSLENPTFGAIFIAWEKDEFAPTVRSVLEQFFSTFQGYGFRANADDVLEVVPPPWAVSVPALAITLDDIVEGTWSSAADDSSVVNYCEVRSQPWRFEPDQNLSDVGVLDAGAIGQRPFGAFASLVDLVPRDILVPTSGYDDAKTYVNGDAVLYSGVRYRCTVPGVTTSTGVKPTGDPMSGTNWEVSPKDDKTDLGTAADTGQVFTTELPLEDQALSQGDVKVNCDLFFSQFRPNIFPSPYNSGTVTEEVTVPDGGTGTLTYTVFGGFGVPAYDDTWEFRLTPDRRALSITVRVRQNPQPVAASPSWIAYRLTVQVGGNRWKQSSSTITARYGLQEHDASTPGLATSREKYGSRELNLDLGLLDISVDTAQKIARSAVETNLNPDVLHTLSLASPYPVSNADLGRLVRLPNGQRGTLVAWQHNEAHEPTTSQFGVNVQVRVESPLVLPVVALSENNIVPISESGVVPVAGGS